MWFLYMTLLSVWCAVSAQKITGALSYEDKAIAFNPNAILQAFIRR
jgi:hypothetical protein